MNFMPEEKRMIKLVQTVAQSNEITGEELQFLLSCRTKKKIDFLLIDIREIMEYSTLSIKGTDLLVPTSTIHLYLDELSRKKGSLMIFYCRSSNRTFQIVHILKRMGFTRIAHLASGIIGYHGRTLKNAPLPHNICTKE